jgi:glycosyltransferase involved in cell wall biosynthesis
MERVTLRRLVAGPPPTPDRIFFHGLWSKGHRNPRQSRLVERLSRLDRHLVSISARRIPRAVQYRALSATAGARERAVIAAANRRYRSLFTFSHQQIPLFRGRVVVDHDEPLYTPEEVARLNHPNVAAVVVCDEGAIDRYAQLGLRPPCVWIPQGVDLDALSPAAIAAAGAAERRNGELVVGYIAASFLTAADRNHHPVHDVDHLLELWDEIVVRVPEARLWLIGGASARARACVAERPSVSLFEDIPYGGAMPYVANFDIGLYPRRWRPPGPETPVKLIEYMGAGVPTVAYDLGDADVVRDAGAGLLSSTPREFVAAVERLARDEPERGRLAAAGRAVAPAYDWSRLVRRYEDEVLDRYLS